MRFVDTQAVELVDDMNRCEAEIDAIRDNQYEKYEHMAASGVITPTR